MLENSLRFPMLPKIGQTVVEKSHTHHFINLAYVAVAHLRCLIFGGLICKSSIFKENVSCLSFKHNMYSFLRIHQDKRRKMKCDIVQMM